MSAGNGVYNSINRYPKKKERDSEIGTRTGKLKSLHSSSRFPEVLQTKRANIPLNKDR